MTPFSQRLLADGTCVVEVTGELDLATADGLLAAARQGMDNASALDLSLRSVSFIDSTGLGALVLIRNEGDGAGKPVRLVDVPAVVSRLLLITGLDAAFDIVSSDDSDAGATSTGDAGDHGA